MSRNDCRQQQVSFDQTATATDEIRNMHDIFPDPYRRAILCYLQQADGVVSLREVARTIDQWRPTGDEAESEYGEQPQRWLRDTHLIPMDEFGIIVYDSEEDLVWLPRDVSFSVTNPWASA